MKKIIISTFTLLFLSFSTATLESCTKVVSSIAPATCVNLLADYTNAFAAYFNSPTDKTKCQALKNAAQKYLDGCSTLSASEKKDLQNQINSASC